MSEVDYRTRDKKMKAEDLQLLIYWYCRHRSIAIMAPNIHLLIGESDFVSVTKAGYAVEYEVKVTRSDFRADFKKDASYYKPGNWRAGRTEFTKHEILASPAGHPYSVPRRFWFVTPRGLITPDEIPAHAGLLQPGEQDWQLETLKEAPAIKGAKKLTDRQKGQIMRSLSCRFWDLWLAGKRNPWEPDPQRHVKQSEGLTIEPEIRTTPLDTQPAPG